MTDNSIHAAEFHEHGKFEMYMQYRAKNEGFILGHDMSKNGIDKVAHGTRVSEIEKE